MKKRHISKIIVSVCVILVFVLSLASCDIFAKKVSDLGGVKPSDLYRASVRSYRDAKESGPAFSADITWEQLDNSGKTTLITIAYDGALYSASIDGKVGEVSEKESVVFYNGKMYYSDKSGGKHAYDSTRNDVVNYVENSTSAKYVQPAMFKDYPDSWFDGLKLKVLDDERYSVTIKIDEKKSLDNREHSKFYVDGSVVTLYFTGEGALDSMILENVKVNGIKSKLTLDFKWSDSVEISIPDDNNSYQNKGFYSYSSGKLPGTFHDHLYGEWYENTATCTEAGVKTRECTVAGCSEKETKDAAALGHDKVLHEGKAATCTEEGYKAYETCSRCDYTTYTLIAPTGHSMGKWVTAIAATCTEGGTETSKCINCDYVVSRDIGPLGHDIVSHNKKAPTCTEAGHKAYETCSRCEAHNTFEAISPLGHSFIDCEAKPATCTLAGCNAHRACEVCGHKEEYEVIPALGHKITAYAQKNPTCTENGYKAYEECSECDYTTYVVLNMLGHNITTIEAKAPTCTEIGWTEYKKCLRENCGLVEGYSEIASLGHDYVTHEAKAPTCTEIGWTEYKKCLRENCGLVVGYSEFASLGHDYITHEAKAPTCTEIGWNEYQTCGRDDCDYTTRTEIEANGHSFGEWYVSIPGDCTNGEERRECLVDGCDHYETRIPAHDFVHCEGKAPTCYETGHEDYDVCTKCGYVTPYAEIPITHTYGEPVHTDATCTEPETDVRECTICGHVDVVYGKGNGHLFENGSCTLCGREDDYSLPIQKFE